MPVLNSNGVPTTVFKGDLAVDRQEGNGPESVITGVVASTGVVGKVLGNFSGTPFLARPISGAIASASNPFTAIPTVNGSALTFGRQHFAEDDFYSVQFLFKNPSATAQTVTLAKCAVAATHLNDGGSLSWVSITVGGATTFDIPAGSGSVASSVAGWVLSDVIRIKSTPRTDNPTYKPLLQTRVYMQPGICYLTASTWHLDVWNSADVTVGRQVGNFYAVGDQVTTPGVRTMTDTGNGFMAPVEPIFYYGSAKYTATAFGDSLFVGSASSAAAATIGFLQRAAIALTEAGLPLSLSNHAVSGSTSSSALANLRAFIAAGLKTDFVFLKNWSRNDGWDTDAKMETGWANLLESIQLCRTAGFIPVVCTSPPDTDYVAYNSRRVEINRRTLLLAGSVIVADIAAVLEDPANPGKINPDYNCGDNVHGNTAYQVAAAPVVSNAILTTLS